MSISDGDSYLSGYASPDTVRESIREPAHPERFDDSSGLILPPPSEEGFALREWRRLNAIRLADKEKEEKAMLQMIIDESEELKREFYKKRLLAIENRKASNREKQQQYVENHERFHTEAQKNYWKAVAELLPHEMPTIEKKGKKDKAKLPSVAVITGPKPGKPTDLSRMRQVLVKLKHNSSNPKPEPNLKAGTNNTASNPLLK